jgi:hypothetical protein
VGRRYFQIIRGLDFCYVLENKVVLSFGNFGGQGFPQNFGDIVLDGRDGFSLRIFYVKNIAELKLCLMYIDDSSMIFVFLLHMFLVNNFQCEIVQ